MWEAWKMLLEVSVNCSRSSMCLLCLALLRMREASEWTRGGLGWGTGNGAPRTHRAVSSCAVGPVQNSSQVARKFASVARLVVWIPLASSVQPRAFFSRPAGFVLVNARVKRCYQARARRCLRRHLDVSLSTHDLQTGCAPGSASSILRSERIAGSENSRCSSSFSSC